jgi:hypothetical protein
MEKRREVKNEPRESQMAVYVQSDLRICMDGPKERRVINME